MVPKPAHKSGLLAVTFKTPGAAKALILQYTICSLPVVSS